MGIVNVEWVANWACPKCGNPCDDSSYDIDFDDSLSNVECCETIIDNEGVESACGHEYMVRC